MKAALQLELFGENYRKEVAGLRNIYSVVLGEKGAYRQLGPSQPCSTWVAEIIGPDPIYRLKRKFIDRKIDYAKSNGVGSRGVYAEYIMESWGIYEVSEQVSWKRVERYFCTVTEEGDIIKITEVEACHAVEAETCEEWRARHEKLPRY